MAKSSCVAWSSWSIDLFNVDACKWYVRARWGVKNPGLRDLSTALAVQHSTATHPWPILCTAFAFRQIWQGFSSARLMKFNVWNSLAHITAQDGQITNWSLGIHDGNCDPWMRVPNLGQAEDFDRVVAWVNCCHGRGAASWRRQLVWSDGRWSCERGPGSARSHPWTSSRHKYSCQQQVLTLHLGCYHVKLRAKEHKHRSLKAIPFIK